VVIAACCQPFHQRYCTRVVTENGKIITVRQFLDTVPAARLLLAHGLTDVPAAK
jgi:ketosteroid isomerase-like protein